MKEVLKNDLSGLYTLTNNKFTLTDGTTIEIKERYDYAQTRKSRYYLFDVTNNKYLTSVFDNYKMGGVVCSVGDVDGIFYMIDIGDEDIVLQEMGKKDSKTYK